MTDELKEEVEKIADSKQKVEERTVLTDQEDYLQKLRDNNEAIRKEEVIIEERRAKAKLGGKADAGQPEKPQQDIDNEEATKILDMFKEE